MKPATIHHLNSALIILSCLIAMFIPFELFLFSYGVLGPLHYLTEIGWLHKKNYFTKGKYDFLFLVFAGVLIVYWNFNPPKNYLIIAHAMIFTLLASIAFVFVKDMLYRIVIIAMAVLFIGIFKNTASYFTWAAIFLPTIIHVFIFTWAFMLYGVIKEKSVPGIISICVLIICSIFLFVFQPQNLFYDVKPYIQKSYKAFEELNFQIINLFNMANFKDVKEIYISNAGFVVMRFIAFAYTYHYLNWFSKTSVIKWHLVPKTTLVFTIALWLLSIALYAYDYNLGLNVLFFLSFLHVFLEFPLNIVSFTGIGKAILSIKK
ncbi:MAG: hypothetical protein JSU07_00170 [Bacteroidetes bacterium]|nr:hypothetical protein [Bacteroidota bacterium]